MATFGGGQRIISSTVYNALSFGFTGDLLIHSVGAGNYAQVTFHKVTATVPGDLKYQFSGSSNYISHTSIDDISNVVPTFFLAALGTVRFNSVGANTISYIISVIEFSNV